MTYHPSPLVLTPGQGATVTVANVLLCDTRGGNGDSIDRAHGAPSSRGDRWPQAATPPDPAHPK